MHVLLTEQLHHHLMPHNAQSVLAYAMPEFYTASRFAQLLCTRYRAETLPVHALHVSLYTAILPDLCKASLSCALCQLVLKLPT